MDWQAIGLTLQLAAVTTVIPLVIAVPLATWLALSRRRWTAPLCPVMDPHRNTPDRCWWDT